MSNEYGSTPDFLRFLRKVLRLINQYLYVIMFVCIIYGLFKQPMPGLSLWGILLGCLILSYIFRDFSRRGVLLLVTHVALGVGCFFLIDNPFVRLLAFCVLVGFFIDGMMYIRSHYLIKRIFEAPWPCMIFGVIAIALGYHIGDVTLQRVGYIMPVLIIFIYLVSLYVDGLEEYLNGARRVSGAPMKMIISTNSLIVTGILTVFVVTILLGNALHLDRVLKDVLVSSLVIVRIIVAIIIFILKFVFSIMFGDNVSVAPPKMKLEEETGDNVLGSILDLIFVTAVIIITVLVVILFFRWLIRLLLSRQKRRDEVTEELTVARKVKVTKEKYTKSDKLKGSTPDMIARRMYKNRVLSYKKFFTPERNSTTDDIKNLIILRPMTNKKYFSKKTAKDEAEIDPENVAKLTEMYEEVRYGEKMPDDDFLRKMKKIKL